MHIDVNIHAQADLKAISALDKDGAFAVMAALEQIEADPKVIDKLLTRGDNQFGNTLVNVKAWQAAKKKGNLWRFRILDTPATVYRIVYGYHYQTRQLCILAVVHKETFNYDDLTSDIAQRILADWNAL